MPATSSPSASIDHSYNEGETIFEQPLPLYSPMARLSAGEEWSGRVWSWFWYSNAGLLRMFVISVPVDSPEPFKTQLLGWPLHNECRILTRSAATRGVNWRMLSVCQPHVIDKVNMAEILHQFIGSFSGSSTAQRPRGEETPMAGFHSIAFGGGPVRKVG